MTSGRWLLDSIASFSEFRTALGAALDSYTSTSDSLGAAAVRTSRSSVVSPPGASGFLIPTPNSFTCGLGIPKQLSNRATSAGLKPSISSSATRSPAPVKPADCSDESP
jgi:hypothetical protein